jgi:hypothetical protein
MILKKEDENESTSRKNNEGRQSSKERAAVWSGTACLGGAAATRGSPAPETAKTASKRL